VPVYALDGLVPVIHPEAFVHPDAVVIGDVTVGAHSTVWPCTVLRGDYGRITVGERTSVQDGTVVHATAEKPTSIGSDCVIGHAVHLEGCSILDRVLVGNGAIVMHDVVAHAGSVIAAGAVLRNGTVVPERAMARGVPAVVHPDAVVEDLVSDTVDLYVGNGRRYRESLRRLDA
jgi:carbonic anhydrase/acetyltransferase-like protein (isoleucine patch superfamily)